MTELPEETLLAITFDRLHDGGHYATLPPHITLVPWFDTDDHPSAMAQVEDTLSAAEPFDIRRAGPIEASGPAHEKSRIKVVSEDLVNIHCQLFNKLVAVGVEFRDPEVCGENYTPHYNEIPDTDPFEKSDVLKVSEVAIIKNAIIGQVSNVGFKKINYRKLGPTSV